MPFISPLALAGLVFIPAVIAMYLLKLRRDQAVVPSTLLWSRLLTDVEANAPWQRLRRSLLLLIQLLLVLALVLLAARPFLERPAGLARDVVLVMDTSASMGATDVAPNRLAAARDAAMAALKDLPTGGKVSVIAADRTARIVVNETTDLGRVRQAIDDLRPAPTRGDLGDALELASKLATRSGEAQILVATDAALSTPPTVKVSAPIKVLPVGRDRKNQAIVAMAVRTAPSAVTRSVFISIANVDLERADRRIELWGDDRLLEARDVTLEAQARADVVIDDVPNDIGTVEARLVSRDASVTTPDQLAVDDHAWAVLPAARTRLVLVVGEGDPYLETALSYLPNVELYGVAPKDYGASHPAHRRAAVGPHDLRGRPAGHAADDPDPRDRAAEDQPARRGHRHADGPGHRLARPGRADPALRGPVHDPHLGRAAADDPGLGPDRHPGAERLAAALHRRPRGAADRRPGLRAAALRPAAAGRLPDPALEPDRRAPRRVDRADRRGRARRAGHASRSRPGRPACA